MDNDLIHRNELLAELERLETVCECPGIDFSELRKVIAKIPAVMEPEEPLIPVTQEKLFVKEYPSGRKEYRYGPEWVAMQLFMEGGYATPEEAKQRWEDGRA